MKKRVTEKSLRVGQTVYIVMFNPFKGKRSWYVNKFPYDTNLKKHTFLIKLLDEKPTHFFYSKKKAKTKMRKLNGGLK